MKMLCSETAKLSEKLRDIGKRDQTSGLKREIDHAAAQFKHRSDEMLTQLELLETEIGATTKRVAPDGAPGAGPEYDPPDRSV